MPFFHRNTSAFIMLSMVKQMQALSQPWIKANSIICLLCLIPLTKLYHLPPSAIRANTRLTNILFLNQSTKRRSLFQEISLIWSLCLWWHLTCMGTDWEWEVDTTTEPSLSSKEVSRSRHSLALPTTSKSLNR